MKKKYAIVTGAGGYLGKYHCETLIKNHYNVIALDKNVLKLNILKKKFNNIKSLIIYKIDLTKTEQITKFGKYIKKKKHKIRVLINNAAIDAVPTKTKKKYFFDVVKWNLEISVGLTAAYLMTLVCAENMIKQNNGIIINIGSDLSVIAPNQKIYKKVFKNYIKPASYSVIKHGLLGMTKYFASTYAQYKINCNMISPGPIDKKIKNSFTKELKNIIPMKNLIPVSNVQKIVELLIKNDVKFITGQNIIIDGGRTII